VKFYRLSRALAGLDLSAHRTELSIITALFLFARRDVIAHRAVAIDVVDIALR